MIGSIMKELRKNKGMTIAKAAETFGVAARTYTSYELEEREPNLTMLCKIADFYDVTTDYLLGRKNMEPVFATLNINLDKKQFIDIYQELPEYQQQLLVDAMKKLGASAEKGRAIIAEKQKLGTIEDDNTENETARQDAG